MSALCERNFQGADHDDPPEDIYPESRSRLPLPKREALDEQGKRVYDSVLDPKRPTLAGFRAGRHLAAQS